MPQPKVIIIGGGFGGLNVAKSLKKSQTEILLIDKTNHHLFQPLLYQVATAALSPGEIATPIREVLRDNKNTTVVMGDVVEINKESHEIVMKNGEKISYDYLVIATGARHSYFSHDEWGEHAPGLKTLKDALTIRDKILISFEKAERMEKIEDAEKHLNFVCIGGGPTGVEMAGAIAEIAYKTMFKNFRRINPDRSKIYLIEALPHILPTYHESLRLNAKKSLEKMGVHVWTNRRVTSICEDGVQVNDEFILSQNVIWAAGNQASPLLKTLNVELDRSGRVIVDPDLSIPNHPEVFVIGDASCCKGKNGNPLPGIAPTAIQMGSYVSKVIKKQIPKIKRKPFKYLDKGMMATIGKSKAVAAIGSFRFTGILAWLAWSFIHIVYLVGFRNRFGVMVEWFYIFFTGQRGVRLIYRSLDQGLSKVE